MTYLCPVIEVTGNFSVKSVYTVPSVSAAKNSMNTSSLLVSSLGVLSSTSSAFCGCVERMFFLFRSRCPFAVAMEGFRCFATSVVLIPGHVKNCSFWMDFNHVDLTGLNKDACKNLIISSLVDICSKLHAIFAPSEVGM